MENKISIIPFVNLVNTLGLKNMQEVSDFNRDYFQDPLDVTKFNDELLNMSKYVQQDIEFWEDININEWGLYCLSSNTSKTGDFWYDNYLILLKYFEEFLYSGTDVSFITYYEEEIDEIEDERLYTIIFHLMDKIKHTPETLELLSINVELFNILYSYLTPFEKMTIVDMNNSNLKNLIIKDKK